MSNPAVGIEAYPLQWPVNKPRTSLEKRERSNFGETSFAKIRDQILNEIKLLRGRQAQPKDSGIAVYFLDRGSRQKCIACDRWHKVEHNLKAIAYTIDALRSVERWGTGDMVEAAFAGFTALPPAPTLPGWAVVFGMPSHSPTDTVLARFRELALRHHPDRGASHEEMAAVNRPLDEFKRERGLS